METQPTTPSFTPPKSKKKTIVIIASVVLIASLLGLVGFLIVKVTQEQPEEVIVSSEESGTADANGLSLGDPEGSSATSQDVALQGVGGQSTQQSGNTGSSGSGSPQQQQSLSPPGQSTSGQPKPVRSQTLPNGLKIDEYVYGSGAASQTGSKLAMHYVGYLTNGTVFDTSMKGNKQPFVFTLGSGQVIPGWDIGLQDMRVGAVRRLTIPASLAYGAAGSPPSIPPNSTLIFDVQLMAIQ